MESGTSASATQQVSEQVSPRYSIGVSLKMYFDHARTVAWCRDVAEIARTHPAVTSGVAEVFVLPTFPAIVPALEIFAGTGVVVGAQDLSWADEGAFTGEVSGRYLRELGCTHAEVGHAERRRLFGEDDAMVAAKTAAALRNGLVPVLCVGEEQQGDPADAARACVRQVESAVADAAAAGVSGRLVVAYEPQWAIGAPKPAPVDHVAAVAEHLAGHLAGHQAYAGSRVVYGGSAGPGLLTELGASVAGLFLGRFAHATAAVGQVLDEALDLAVPS